jgi:beta-phosphoglucomutase-like phosphatase (HAD superfamily)
MDGLLFDTERLYQEAIVLAADEHALDVTTDVFARTVGLPWAQSRAMLLAHFGEGFPVDTFQKVRVQHFGASPRHVSKGSGA